VEIYFLPNRISSLVLAEAEENAEEQLELELVCLWFESYYSEVAFFMNMGS